MKLRDTVSDHDVNLLICIMLESLSEAQKMRQTFQMKYLPSSNDQDHRKGSAAAADQQPEGLLRERSVFF